MALSHFMPSGISFYLTYSFYKVYFLVATLMVSFYLVVSLVSARAAKALTFVIRNKSKQKCFGYNRSERAQNHRPRFVFDFLFVPFLITVEVKQKFQLIGDFFDFCRLLSHGSFAEKLRFPLWTAIGSLQVALQIVVFCLLYVRTSPAGYRRHSPPLQSAYSIKNSFLRCRF